MPTGHLAFDIETVPIKTLTEYSSVIQEKVSEKISRQQERNPDYNYDYFASIHGDFGKIICISLGYISEDNEIRLKSLAGDNEVEILKEFNLIISKHNGIFIHYNGLHFDVPFILQRMAHNGLVPSNRRFSDLRRYSTNPHFDVMMQYYNWDMQRVLPLGILASLYGLPNPKEDLSGDQVFQAYKEEKWDRIIHYCEFDTATTLNLWRKIFRYQPIIPFENYRFSTE